MLGDVPAPRSARLARFLDAAGDCLDQGLALYFPAPASYTGEDVLELQGHGGAVIVDLVLKRLLELGCRMARPGEFSERAFLNGKMDMAQAEAIADLIEAGTGAAARAAVRSLQGEFSARVNQLQSGITELRAYVEAAIDFPDEEIDFLSDSALSGRLTLIFSGFDSITAAARQGALLREGLTVVIAGKPNAGKSSLMNALAGEDVAIVTDVPGTTRDVLRQAVHLDGLPLNLVDTAGLRSAVDVVEAEGVRRARSEITRADRVLYIVDAAAHAADVAAAAAAAAAADAAAAAPDADVAGVGRRQFAGLVGGTESAAGRRSRHRDFQQDRFVGHAAPSRRRQLAAACLPQRQERCGNVAAALAFENQRGIPGCGVRRVCRSPTPCGCAGTRPTACAKCF